MASGTAVQRFLITAHAPGSNGAVVRSFLWLKRRTEEQAQSGLLVLPDALALDGVIAEALGWRLAALFKDEGALPLGDGIEMRWTTYDALRTPSIGPLAAIWPGRRDLQALRYWPGQVLVAPQSQDMLAAWQKLTLALDPPPENYLSHLTGTPPDGGVAVHKEAPSP
jgi:hypothetical protein